jgi:iron complex outermembrane receptor protein
LRAAEATRREFRVPAGDAAETLREFARQSGDQIIYLEDKVRGQRTRPIRGQLVPFAARGPSPGS